jgi:endonuclease YncB( thermonuclease family)
MENERIIIILCCIGFVLSFYWINSYIESKDEIVYEEERTTVIRIIDGDTIETELGVVRLIGINAPERGEKFFKESTNFLDFLIEKEIYMIRVKENRDKYNRFLRYIKYYDEKSKEFVLINEILIEEGYAQLYYFDYDSFYGKLKIAEQKARNNGKNIWQKSNHECVGCLILEDLENGFGKEDCKPRKEYVVIKNNCDFSCNLTSWVIYDDSNRRFVFPDFILEKDSETKVYNGIGEEGIGYFFHNNKPSFGCYSLWGDEKDTFYLRDDKENLVIFYRYGYK